MMELKKFIDELKTLRSEMRAKGQEMLTQAFSAFFERHPVVTKIVWAQYTPYFNDGDPCEFCMNDWDAYIDEDIARDIGTPEYVIARANKYNDKKCRYHYHYGQSFMQAVNMHKDNEINRRWHTGPFFSINAPEYAQLKAVFDDLKDLYAACKEVEKDLLQPVLGDHVLVTVTRDGFDIEEYEHD